jgi:catechol 2,3-dioxygenase-like lactoylglutathione lyase family enzyme
MEPRLSFVTLGVTDLERSRRFYRNLLGIEPRPTPPEVAFFELGKTWLSLYSRESLAADAGISPEGSGFAGIALSHNVRSQEEVDEVLRQAEAAGATVLKSGHRAYWGGYIGYFSDPDGYVWEIAWNPSFPHV